MRAEGLRLLTTLNAFSYIRPGQQVQSAIGYETPRAKPSGSNCARWNRAGCRTVTAPREIAPGEQGSINVAYLIPEADPPTSRLRDALEVRVDGRTNGTAIVTHGIGIDRAEAGTGGQKRPESADNRKYY